MATDSLARGLAARATPGTVLDYVNASTAGLRKINYTRATNALDVGGGAILARGSNGASDTLYTSASGVRFPPAVTNQVQCSWGPQLYTSATNTTRLGTTITGDITNGSPTITNVADTSALAPGMFVSSANTSIPVFSKILSIVPNTSVTISANATGTSAGVTIYAYPGPDANGYAQFFTDNMTRADTALGDLGTPSGPPAASAYTLLGAYNGSTWPAATQGQISSNKFVVAPGSIVYAWRQSADGLPITVIKASAVWVANGGATGAEGSLALVMSSGANVPTQENNIHVSINRADYIAIGYWNASGALVNVYNDRPSWHVTHPADGSTVVDYELIFDQWTKTVTVKVGSNSISISDSHFTAGDRACWEIYAPATGGNNPAAQPAITSASWGRYRGLETYVSTAGGGFFSRNYTVPNDSNTHRMAILVKKSAASAWVGLTMALVGGTGLNNWLGFNTNTGVIDLNTDSGAVYDLGDAWLATFQVTNNSTGNTTLQLQIHPGGFPASGHNVAGSVSIGGLNLFLNSSSLSALIDTYGTSAARGSDTITIAAPRSSGRVLGFASIGTGTQVAIDAAISSGVFSLPSGLSGQTVPTMVLY